MHVSAFVCVQSSECRSVKLLWSFKRLVDNDETVPALFSWFLNIFLAYLTPNRPLDAFLVWPPKNILCMQHPRPPHSIFTLTWMTEHNSIHGVWVESLINIRWDTFIAQSMLCLLFQMSAACSYTANQRVKKKDWEEKKFRLKTNSKTNTNSVHASRRKKEGSMPHYL